MVKNILLVVMTILALMFFIFGYIQKIEADRQTELANQMMEQTEKAKIEIDKLRIMVEAVKLEAEKQRTLASEAIANCEKSKKK